MTYASEVAADSPAGFWWLDEPSGTTVNDSSGNGHGGSYINSPTLGVSGPIAGHTAVLFSNAGSSYAQITTHSSLHVSNSTDPWTIEAWFKGANGVGDFNGPSVVSVIYDGVRVDFNLGFWSGTAVGNKPSIGYYNGAHVTCQSASSIADGAWHHLVGTFDGTDLKIYVDKVLKQTTTPSAPSTRGSQDLLIAKRWDAGGVLDGSVAAVAVYASALTSTRIAAHYDAASSQTVTIGRATEADVAHVVAPNLPITVAVGRAGETDIGRTLTAVQTPRTVTTVVIGQALERNRIVRSKSAARPRPPFLVRGPGGTLGPLSFSGQPWTMDIQDPNGASTVLANAPFRKARIIWTVEGPGSIEITLRTSDVSTDWAPGLHRVVVHGPVDWAGYLTGLSRSGKPKDLEYIASGLGLASILDWRLVRHDTTLNDEAAVLVEWLLDEAQTQINGDMNFRMGSVNGTTVTRLRNYCFGVVIGEAIRELASIGRGFDWEIDAEGRLNIWNGSRGVPTGFDLFETDTQDWNVTLDTSELLTTVSAIGDPSNPFGPRHMGVAAGFADDYGRRETGIDVDTNDLAELEDAATAELTAGGGGRLQVHTMWIDDRGPWMLGDVWLQDKVQVHVEDCFGGTQMMRCTDITVTLDPLPERYFIEHTFDALVEDIFVEDEAS